MKKTLAVIINHNRKSYTNQLYTSLKPYESVGNYYLTVLDNGTPDKNEISEYTEYAVEENTYYGGAVNLIFQLMLESQEYDSVLIFNNDIILHPYTFIKDLRSVMFDQNYYVVSPSVIQPEQSQCFWKQMHGWGSPTPRTVKWVDFMCPLIRREVVEEIKEYSSILRYGWGQDLFTGVVCEQKSWPVAVVDTHTVIHLSSQTYKDSKSDMSLSEYGSKAMVGMYQFFDSVGLRNKLEELRNFGQYYQWRN